MRTVTCSYFSRATALVEVREAASAAQRALEVPVERFAAVLGSAALSRLRLRGTLTLTLFDDEWSALTRGGAVTRDGA
ncbi:hypothetical protein [Deinococcus pimensis]|uniref:hypothetical protein n=1 Tax=Deinococcus pimensis TaxID=309888 RepID=UPI000484F016|nr:hypothetical protein [Deinococcus pimensis]